MSGSTTGIVVFDYAGWTLRYPELSAFVSQPLATIYFNEATMYVDNTAASIVADYSVGGARSTLLNMLTAHIAALNYGVSGQAPSPLVGRVSGATEGSVSVQAEYTAPGTAAWFLQTKYGAAFWQASAQYRTMQYFTPPQPFTQDYYG